VRHRTELQHRGVQRVQGWKLVLAREQSLSYWQGHVVRWGSDHVHRPEYACAGGGIVPDDRSVQRRMRWKWRMPGLYAECNLHSAGQALPARHDDVHQWSGLRLAREHQRGQGVWRRSDLLGRNMRGLQCGFVRERLLRQHRVRDGGADRRQLRHEGRRLRSLSEQRGLHDGGRRVLLPAVDDVVRERVRQHADG
jgi:hypothetical protein